jgi:DNA/RNA endonuclease G (NUC1)
MRQQKIKTGEVIVNKQKVTSFFLVIAVLVMFINTVSAQTSERNVDWDRVSENLVNAIQSGNPGVQQAAMRLVIQFSDKVDVSGASKDIMRIYRYSENTKERQLALVTLHKIHSEYAMDFVKRNMKFETDEKIIKMTTACLSEYNSNVASVDKGKELASK